MAEGGLGAQKAGDAAHLHLARPALHMPAALTEAKKSGIESVAFLGRGGGKAKGLATCELIMPGQSGAAAQEAHLFLIHHFCELVDAAFPA